MRSTEEFWNRRNLAEWNDLENWLLSRQVLPQQQTNGGVRTPTSSASGNRRNRRSRSEERPKNNQLLHHVGSHHNLAGKDILRGNNNNKERGIVGSEKEFRMSKMLVPVNNSEDSGNSSLNTSTTDSRKSRRNQNKLIHA